MLCAWAITWEGTKVLNHLAPGTKESTDCVRDFLPDLQRRGLSDPVLVVTDGAAGLIGAVEECFPASLGGRCPAHKMRNLMGKLPESVAAEFKQAAQAADQAPSPANGKGIERGPGRPLRPTRPHGDSLLRRGLRGQFELGQLERLQKQLAEGHLKENEPVVKRGSTTDRGYSKKRT